MKTNFTYLAFIFFLGISCKNSHTSPDKNSSTPTALEEKNSSGAFLTKSRTGDLVEELYQEIANKTKDLKDMELAIKDIYESKEDSTEKFNTYNSKIQLYFNSASEHTLQIKDSLIKEKMQQLIANNLSQYNLRISDQKDLLALIDSGNNTLTDLHTVVKIVSTIPLINQFEIDKIPSISPLIAYKNKLDKTIKMTEKMANK